MNKLQRIERLETTMEKLVQDTAAEFEACIQYINESVRESNKACDALATQVLANAKGISTIGDKVSKFEPTFHGVRGETVAKVNEVNRKFAKLEEHLGLEYKEVASKSDAVLGYVKAKKTKAKK